MAQFHEIFPELTVDRLFTPAEAHALAGPSPQTQRNWRHRKLVPFDRRPPEAASDLPAPFTWEQVMQWALMFEAQARGMPLADAGLLAAHEKLQQLHRFDFRRPYGPQLFIFYRLGDDGQIEVSTHGGKITFDTDDPWWGNFGSWLNYSKVQRDVVARYEARRG